MSGRCSRWRRVTQVNVMTSVEGPVHRRPERSSALPHASPTLGLLCIAVAVAGVVSACGGGGANSASTSSGSYATIHVPADAPTIQAGVDKAAPGDLVVIAPGTYRESVLVKTDRIVIRGENRNTVILDGRHEMDDGITVVSDGVAVENMTIRRFLNNGLIFNGVLNKDGQFDAKRPPLKGWRGSYITAHNNGLYGVYAFASHDGVFDHIYASGSADSGIYIGQCVQCNAVVTDSVMEGNSIGYEGTNSSDDIYLINSVMRRNRIGIASNSGRREQFAPSRNVTIAGNLVSENDNPNTPPTEGSFGVGIALGGSETVKVIKNRVVDNPSVGILVTDQEGNSPVGNRVTGNLLARNGVDLAFFRAFGGSLAVAKNCFEKNTSVSSFPADIERVLACATPTLAEVPGRVALPAQPPGMDYEKVPAPGPQPSMPDIAGAPAPAVDVPPAVDLATITIPKAK